MRENRPGPLLLLGHGPERGHSLRASRSRPGFDAFRGFVGLPVVCVFVVFFQKGHFKDRFRTF
ncbi:MAG: hypothetical protein JWM04_52 [Verrucomicrobiales bacterium]|nr:hypothetical protein [Verrucomicrobiales bacterium]